MFHDLKPQFEREGFVTVRGFLAPDELAELSHELDRYVREVVPGLPDGDAFYDVDREHPATLKQLHRIDQDAYFAEYRSHPRWRSLAEALLGEPAAAESPEWFNKPPLSRHGTPPHQDNYYFNLNPCSVVTLWLALDKVDDDNGCMRYVVGSHLTPVRPHGASKALGFSQGIVDYGPGDQAREVRIHLEPGDVTAHHGNLIHLAGPNRSHTRHRRAFAMVFKGSSCRRDEQAHAHYLAALKTQHAVLAAESKAAGSRS
jgi:phytanoyl-CoA hydroxylase